MLKEKTVFYGTGRRKNAIAKVWISDGSGQFVINGKKMTELFPRLLHQKQMMEPLEAAKLTDKIDIKASTLGGGITGQAGAVRLGLARALVERDETLRRELRAHGCLTRDPRMKERKKYGQKRARKRFQFSKR